MELLNKIQDKKAIVGVVGLGYVGLPLLMEFVERDIKTVGFDIDEKKTKMLNDGKSYIKHIDQTRVKAVRDSKLFEATTDFSRIKEVDCIFVIDDGKVVEQGSHEELSLLNGRYSSLAKIMCL